jgi:hypothetical protein
MIQIIVVIASILLGMILYPIFLRKWKQLLSWLYLITYEKSEEGAKAQQSTEIVSEKAKTSSIIGESKFNLSQSKPNTATNLESENTIKKEFTFVPGLKNDDSKMDHIDVSLEKIESLSEEEFDEQTEQEELETEPNAICASGASFDELIHINHTIANIQASQADKEEAGRVLYENEQTEMVEQVVANSEETARAISSLIDVHLAMRAQRLQQDDDTIYPEDLKNFDIDSIF